MIPLHLLIWAVALAAAHGEMGNKLINVATTESHPALGNALRKLGRAWHSLTDLDQAQAISECVVIGDTFGYQGMNARSAKEALLQRAGVLEEYQAAVKATISKRRNIERLKASSNIRPERVDDALEDIEEVSARVWGFFSLVLISARNRPINTSKYLPNELTTYPKIFIVQWIHTSVPLQMISPPLYLSMLARRSCTRSSYFENWKPFAQMSTMPARRWHLQDRMASPSHLSSYH